MLLTKLLRLAECRKNDERLHHNHIQNGVLSGLQRHRREISDLINLVLSREPHADIDWLHEELDRVITAIGYYHYNDSTDFTIMQKLTNGS